MKYRQKVDKPKKCKQFFYNIFKCICGVIISLLALNVVDRGFEPHLGQTKYYIINICCYSAEHATLKGKNKDCLVRNQDNMSDWSDMSTRRLLFQWTSTIKIQLSMLVFYKADIIIIIILLKCNLFLPWYDWKISHLALNNNYSITHTYHSSRQWIKL